MKNRIWLGKCSDGREYASHDKIIKTDDGLIVVNSWGYRKDIYALNLKPLEIVEVIIDTETQKYEVVRPREVGWYLVECSEYDDDDGIVFACHWNGENWVAVRNKNKWKRGTIWGQIPDDKITVLSDKLPYNEHLRSLE